MSLVLEDLKFEDVSSISISGTEFKSKLARFPTGGPSKDVLGIDPGRNLGICLLGNSFLRVYWGTMPKGEWEDYAVEAFEIATAFPYAFSLIVLEGAAYREGPGQVGLAGVRWGLYLGFQQRGIPVKTVPPSTIRKGAFGHGNKKGGDIWPLLNLNAADAVGAALYAASLIS